MGFDPLTFGLGGADLRLYFPTALSIFVVLFFQAVVSTADIYLTNKDMMIVILGALCKNYPDATPTQLERLIGFHEEFRGEAGRNGVKSAFASVPKGQASRSTVFSHPELRV